jgi:uncharacterized protein (TIGR00661 family)
MKILYAIQGTGNGHLSRARDIIPLLQQKGELDLLVSGTEAEIELPYTIKYRLGGLSFVFGKKGGVDMVKTFKKGSLKRLKKEIAELPVEGYDIVISDFEPVSAWACRKKNKPCIGLSHQSAVMNKDAPKPKKNDYVGQLLLKNYAPVTKAYGFHFKHYTPDIFTPVIRSEIRDAVPTEEEHYVVYLPAYSDKRIMNFLENIPNIKWYVFSKTAKSVYKERNIYVYPVNNDLFVSSMITCSGVLCGAGFETPAEALFMKKKLLVVPMKGQYEQQCNAAALKEMGVPVIKNLDEKHIEKVISWSHFSTPPKVDYPDNTATIIDQLFEEWALRERELELKMELAIDGGY